MVDHWIDNYDFLGKDRPEVFYETLKECEEIVRPLQLSSALKFSKWRNSLHGDKRIPSNPDKYYPDWIGWDNFLGKTQSKSKRYDTHRNRGKKLYEKQIVSWIKDYINENNGKYPNKDSGQIEGTTETWSGINNALMTGSRGMIGKSSLAKFMESHFVDYRNQKNLPNLSIPEILKWGDIFFDLHGRYPRQNDGQISGTSETWKIIDHALRAGKRGLTKGYSLSKLFQEKRGCRNKKNLPTISEDTLIRWIKEYKKNHSNKYPTCKNKNYIKGTDEKWVNIDSALRIGLRGFPGCSSLTKFIEDNFADYRNQKNLPHIGEKKLKEWCDRWYKEHDKYPQCTSGEIWDTGETWSGIRHALKYGTRGFPGRSSLAQFIQENFGNNK